MEITDLPKLRHAFGDDLLVAFCRCFVWTDRLMSMNILGLQIASLEATSVRFGRNVELRYSHLLPKASYRACQIAGRRGTSRYELPNGHKHE